MVCFEFDLGAELDCFDWLRLRAGKGLALVEAQVSSSTWSDVAVVLRRSALGLGG